MSEQLSSLLQQIASKLSPDDQYLVTDLQQAIDAISKDQADSGETRSRLPSKDKSGCYRYEGDAAFYCPDCFDRRQQRIPTQRLNRQLRVCPQCRTSIRPTS